MIAPDSSVTIAAAAPWHVAHAAAVAALASGSPSLIAHVAYETTAAMSRMPEGQRLAQSVVLAWLEQRSAIRGSRCRPTPLRCAPERRRARFRGGALYGALIAATAAHHEHTLLSADRRAASVYATLDVDVVYVVAG